MKTRLYTLILGLLMAAFTPIFGQEIVGEFISTTQSYTCDIMETAKGGLLVASQMPNGHYIIYKLSSEGALLDSITMPIESDPAYLLELPSGHDNFLFASHTHIPGNMVLDLILFDAELNIIDETSISIPHGESYSFASNCFFTSPNNEVFFVYNRGSDIHTTHFVRIMLDGFLWEDQALTEIPHNAWMGEPSNDTTLYYSDYKVFSETPLTYSCLGQYNENGTTHFVNYLLDDDFNLVNHFEYAPSNPNMAFTSDYLAHITPLSHDSNSHLMSCTLNTNGAVQAPAIVKYDDQGYPIATAVLDDESPMIYQTDVKDDNTIYFTYGSLSFGASQHLVRLDANLNTVWDMLLPCSNTRQHWVQSTKTLRNGNIALGLMMMPNPNTQLLQVFIIRDGDPTATPEMTATEKPYTLYPNPVKDLLTLRFDDGHEPESVELYDLAGSLVAKQCKALGTIDMSAMPSGVYMLRVTMKDGTRYHEKVLKE